MKISFLKRNKYHTGFTIVELIITIALLSFGIVGVYGAFYSTIRTNYSSSLRFTATYLAQEGLEIIRNMRDKNVINGATWSSGLTSCLAGCQGDYKTGTPVQTPANQLQTYNANAFLNHNTDGFYSYDAGSATQFKRKITMTQELGSDTLKVNVVVSWSYNGEPFSTEAEGYLYNWY